jgi:hypothetical protein
MRQHGNGKDERSTSEKLSRRGFIATAGAGAVAGGLVGAGGVAHAEDREAEAFDSEHDVVICGSGAGGLTTALFSRWLGNDAIVLEKAPSIGGTSIKAAFWWWVPNNIPNQKLGRLDPKDDFLKFVARLTVPEAYDPKSPTYGLTQWEFDMAGAYYDSASPASELLHEKGALPYLHMPESVDYFELPENKAPRGRILTPTGMNSEMSDGGRVAIRQLLAAARKENIPILTSHRIERAILNGNGEVIGVEARKSDGTVHRAKARKAVVFATGGFTHNEELRREFLALPTFGGCAALSNEGDFVKIGSGLGAQLRNMKYAWHCPVNLEKAIQKDGSLIGTFHFAGDSMVVVNKYGRRVVNEKLTYNEMAKAFYAWDGALSENPNIVLVCVWDQRAQEHSASLYYGDLIVPPGGDDRHVIKGATFDELAKNVQQRIKRYPELAGVSLSDDFATTLGATVDRFNGFAREGKDRDFSRGARPIEIEFGGPHRQEPGQINPMMWPLSETGPYYASLVGVGTLDTKGGPKTDVQGRVLNLDDKPIPGLYGVGNCVASPSRATYWGPGATIGPLLGSAYRAANALNSEPRRS